MLNAKPEYFFDLAGYKHAAVFDGSLYVWEAVTNIETYLKNLVLGRLEGKISPMAFLVDPEFISIGKNTTVEPGAYIKGPCVIGENCTIRQGAYIRGNCIAGDHCVIGHGTEVKNALFFDHAHAAHFAYVGDSILGNRVNLGAGTKCANLKMDKTEVAVEIEGEKLFTGRKKLGAIVGDDSQIGCNAVLNPGTLLGKNVSCYPCINVGGFIASNQLVRDPMKVVAQPKL
jgi:UDP-N-acetylglucosamine diphosphorylase / glucose-1-phosphate thymidylyltransferase / UDP-N-acetylgalactosamine diphosphorylase / glucosamine-1-phosphate N-acetyltransferase / galactosamine-1-phosphate N-acetyltransferase